MTLPTAFAEILARHMLACLEAYPGKWGMGA